MYIRAAEDAAAAAPGAQRAAGNAAKIAPPRAVQSHPGAGDALVSAVHREAAGDRDGLAGDKARIVGGEEADDPGIVRRLREAAHRDGLFQRLGDAVGARAAASDPGKERRVGRAWANVVEGDAGAGKLTRDRLAEGNQAAFAGRIDRLARGADAARIGADIDHAPAAVFHHSRS